MAAPWRAAFTEQVAQLKPPTFVLSTLHAVSGHNSSSSSNNNSAAAGPLPYLPRARTVVYRGMWASLPANDKNPAPRNPPAYESDLLAITTDARMDKVPDLLGSTGSNESNQRSLQGGGTGGGGGPVEAVFWAEATNTQWRLRGTAYVLGPDIGSDAAAARMVREKLLSRMRPVSSSSAASSSSSKAAASSDGSGGNGGSWSWDRELTAHFGNLSPLMRGSFRNPPPGTPLDRPNPPNPELRLGQRVEDVHDPVARANFRVVVIVPREVDRVDLSDAERPRRWLYRYLRQDDADDVGYLDADMSLRGERHGDWEVLEVWP